MKSINDLISQLAEKLLPVCETEQLAESESWWLLEALTDKKKSELIVQEKIKLTSDQHKTLTEWLEERITKNKPLQYILGFVPFCGLHIFVKQPILIPRPETEEWCAWLIEKLEKHKGTPLKILDLGAGSGCIALALAKAFPYATVIGVDINPNAIALCEKNKAHNKIKNAIFIKSDLYQELSQHKNSFDLIVSNPPYIPREEYETLSKQVTEWEDKKALVADDEGFFIHKKIVADTKNYLKKNSALKPSQLLIEFGKGQEKKLKKILEEASFENICIHKDLENVDRWVTTTQ